MEKFCTKCGGKLNDDDIFCHNCGAPVSGEDVSPGASDETEESAKNAQDNTNGASSNIIEQIKKNKVFVGVLIFLILIGTYAYKAKKQHIDEKLSSEQVASQAFGPSWVDSNIQPRMKEFLGTYNGKIFEITGKALAVVPYINSPLILVTMAWEENDVGYRKAKRVAVEVDAATARKIKEGSIITLICTPKNVFSDKTRLVEYLCIFEKGKLVED